MRSPKPRAHGRPPGPSVEFERNPLSPFMCRWQGRSPFTLWHRRQILLGSRRRRSFEIVDNNDSDNFSGTIDLIENMGSEILVHIKINESTFRSVLSRSHRLNIGDTINLKPKEGQVHLFNKDGKVIRDE